MTVNILIKGYPAKVSVKNLAYSVANSIGNDFRAVDSGEDITQPISELNTGDSMIVYMPTKLNREGKYLNYRSQALRVRKPLNWVVVSKYPTKQVIDTCDYILYPSVGAKVYQVERVPFQSKTIQHRIGQYWVSDND